MGKGTKAIALALAMSGMISGFGFAHGKEMSPAEREKHLDKMASELKLTQEQKNKIRTIKEEKHKKIEDIESDVDAKIRAELTPDQQAKFDKMKEKK